MDEKNQMPAPQVVAVQVEPANSDEAAMLANEAAAKRSFMLTLGWILVIVSLPGLLYVAAISIVGGFVFLFWVFLLAYIYIWVPSLISLLLGLRLIRKYK